jgi:membrane protein required for colicin V production
LVYNTFYGGLAERPDWMTNSRTYPLLNATSRALVDFVEQRQKAGDPDPKKT